MQDTMNYLIVKLMHLSTQFFDLNLQIKTGGGEYIEW